MKANIETNMDIVNPIPPKIPTPKTRLKFTAVGNSHKPNFTANHVNKVIPTGFPITNPKKIPEAKGILKCANPAPSIVIAVFANANNGKIINATGIL